MELSTDVRLGQFVGNVSFHEVSHAHLPYREEHDVDGHNPCDLQSDVEQKNVQCHKHDVHAQYSEQCECLGTTGVHEFVMDVALVGFEHAAASEFAAYGNTNQVEDRNEYQRIGYQQPVGMRLDDLGIDHRKFYA